jgi:hypothetical protein
MDLDADMVSDQPDDPLRVGRRDAAAGVLEPARQPVDPKPAVRVEHHLDNAGVLEVARNGRPERRAQHARAPGKSFGPK